MQSMAQRSIEGHSPNLIGPIDAHTHTHVHDDSLLVHMAASKVRVATPSAASR